MLHSETKGKKLKLVLLKYCKPKLHFAGSCFVRTSAGISDFKNNTVDKTKQQREMNESTAKWGFLVIFSYFNETGQMHKALKFHPV